MTYDHWKTTEPDPWENDSLQWESEELEAAIDRVGRDRVFARAREVGWSASNPPPKWVWNVIVAELAEQDRRQRSQSERLN